MQCFCCCPEMLAGLLMHLTHLYNACQTLFRAVLQMVIDHLHIRQSYNCHSETNPSSLLDSHNHVVIGSNLVDC